MKLSIVLAALAAIFILTVEGITTIALKEARCQGTYCAGIYCVSSGGCATGCACISNSCQSAGYDPNRD
jgi:hypothetical protein